MRPYILSECNWDFIRSTNYNLAILPWGATEAHNYHLPYGTDNYEVDKISVEAAGLAWEKGARLIVLPLIPFGVNTGQKDIRLTMNLNPSTQLKILDDIVENLNHHNIFKLLIMNGHGGNDFRQMIRETGSRYPDMFICSCNWYQIVDKLEFFENEGDHADEMETSLMLYFEPELVLPLSKAGEGSYKKFKVEGLNEKWAWTERKWLQLTKDTGVGNPLMASADKGERYFKALIDKLAKFLIELENTDINDMYI
jgi:creatinine amidohydrolase